MTAKRDKLITDAVQWRALDLARIAYANDPCHHCPLNLGEVEEALARLRLSIDEYVKEKNDDHTR